MNKKKLAAISEKKRSSKKFSTEIELMNEPKANLRWLGHIMVLAKIWTTKQHKAREGQ